LGKAAAVAPEKATAVEVAVAMAAAAAAAAARVWAREKEGVKVFLSSGCLAACIHLDDICHF
jgi:hypothetical protein